MHPYLPHLLSDIAAAYCNETNFGATKSLMTFEEEMEAIENWVEGEEPNHTFGYYCGLETINFPPPHQLTDEEMTQVIRTFEQMMFTWNMAVSLPEQLPVPRAYSLIIDTLNIKTDIIKTGRMTIDFCTGYAPDCVFKEYCPCLEIWNEQKKEVNGDGTDIATNELPF